MAVLYAGVAGIGGYKLKIRKKQFGRWQVLAAFEAWGNYWVSILFFVASNSIIGQIFQLNCPICSYISLIRKFHFFLYH